MTSRDFCYWLQGYFEIGHAPGAHAGLNADQVELVKKHLAMVFKHEIDPSFGDEKKQGELNEIHNGPTGIGPSGLHNLTLKC